MTTSSHLGTTNMPELWLHSRAFCCVCARWWFFHHRTICHLLCDVAELLPVPQRKSGQLWSSCRGTECLGTCPKGSTWTAATGLWSAQGAWMGKKLWRHKQGSRGKFFLQCEIINETMTKSQYWARDSVLIVCQRTTLCAFRTDLVINLLQTCAMWARPSLLHKDVFSCKPSGNA